MALLKERLSGWQAIRVARPTSFDALEFLPCKGRGTMRSMVVVYQRLRMNLEGRYPSTTAFGGGPPPPQGEE